MSVYTCQHTTNHYYYQLLLPHYHLISYLPVAIQYHHHMKWVHDGKAASTACVRRRVKKNDALLHYGWMYGNDMMNVFMYTVKWLIYSALRESITSIKKSEVTLPVNKQGFLFANVCYTAKSASTMQDCT